MFATKNIGYDLYFHAMMRTWILVSIPKRMKMPVNRSQANKRARKSGSRALTLVKPVRAGFNYATATKLTYVSSFALQISGSGAGVRSFTANGLYDPDITGTGHQPMGFDTFAGIYGKYLVTSSRLTILGMSPTDPDNAAPTSVGIVLSNASTFAYPSVDALMEQGLCSILVLANDNTMYQRAKLTSRVYNPKLFFNIVNPLDLQADLGAVVTANPNTQAYFNIWFGQTPSGTDVGSFNCTIKIVYDVEFFDLLEIAQS